MNQDYLDLLQLFDEHAVKYLVIGGYAVIHYSEPRYTKDLDLWVEASAVNGKRLLSALREFGAPIDNLSIGELAAPGLLYVFGVPPVRVDILNNLTGARFATAWKKRVSKNIEGVKAKIVDKGTLIKLKRLAGRPQDLADLEKLIA